MGGKGSGRRKLTDAEIMLDLLDKLDEVNRSFELTAKAQYEISRRLEYFLKTRGAKITRVVIDEKAHIQNNNHTRKFSLQSEKWLICRKRELI